MQTASATTRLLCVGDGAGATPALDGLADAGVGRFAVETVVDADAAVERLNGTESHAAGGRPDGDGFDCVVIDRGDSADAVDPDDLVDAVDTVETVRAAAPDLPIVLVVGDETPTAAVAAGATEYVHRDAPPERLAARIETAGVRRQRERTLERRNERLGAFADVVSHDIRNPLNVAAGYLDQAERTGSQTAFQRVRAAHDRIQAIVDDVLTLARQGEIDETEPVALGDVARDAAGTVDADGLTLAVTTDRRVTADRAKLRRLFENLFRNAVEHADPPVTVTVGAIDPVPTTTRMDAAGARGFYVADDGPGIPDDERASVFDPGYSTADDGTGFGLSIVRQIAEAHGWSVRVSEAHDGGARFEVVGVEFADSEDAGEDPFGG